MRREEREKGREEPLPGEKSKRSVRILICFCSSFPSLLLPLSCSLPLILIGADDVLLFSLSLQSSAHLHVSLQRDPLVPEPLRHPHPLDPDWRRVLARARGSRTGAPVGPDWHVPRVARRRSSSLLPHHLERR